MATDAVHAADIMLAVIAELKAHLPAGWLTTAAGETALRLLEAGDLMDFPEGAAGLADATPALVVRPLGIALDVGDSGIGGCEMYPHAFRLVHVRQWEQCWDGAGARLNNQTLARARYAKIINKALFADAHGQLDNPALTSADTAGAQVANVTFDSWDLGEGSKEEVAAIRGLNRHLWAIALDFTVAVLAGG